MTIMDITIRPARFEDIPQMCDLLAELFSIESDFVPDREKQVHGLSALIAAAPASTLPLVASHEGRVVGMSTVQTLISTAEGGRVGLIEDVIVDREYRSKGIGTLLLEQIAAWGREQGLKRLQLLADSDNRPALEFYSSLRWISTRLICLRKML
jgi:ribosomal protein S18 acetylase RimI-like enzyme